MKSRRKKRRSYHRILLIISVLSILSMPVLAKENTRVERGGYWRDAEVFVTEYTIPAVYCGENEYKDIDGNIWRFSEKKKRKGKACVLYMSDNGTENVEDDVVLDVK